MVLGKLYFSASRSVLLLHKSCRNPSITPPSQPPLIHSSLHPISPIISPSFYPSIHPPQPFPPYLPPSIHSSLPRSLNASIHPCPYPCLLAFMISFLVYNKMMLSFYSEEEFKKYYRMPGWGKPLYEMKEVEIPNIDVPKAFDWRDKGIVGKSS